jgi:hypothetical protein
MLNLITGLTSQFQLVDENITVTYKNSTSFASLFDLNLHLRIKGPSIRAHLSNQAAIAKESQKMIHATGCIHH